MSKKDFIRGAEATAKANKDFMKKQTLATAELGKRIIQKIDEQGKIIDVILDSLNMQEKKELYNLDTGVDIADIGENEKEVLASYLLTLISQYEQNTDQQKEYYFAVKKHLQVTNVSDELNLSLVENIDSRSELKAIFQTICEFLFLKSGDASFLDLFEEQIECFGLPSKTIIKIIETIENVYEALGIRGIVEHYIPAEAEEKQLPEHFGLAEPLSGEFIFNDSNRDIPVGAEQVFENLRIVIPKQLHIDGKVIFKNCEIVFDYDGTLAIYMLGSDSWAEFSSCEFIISKKCKATIIGVDYGTCILKDSKISSQAYEHGCCDNVLKDGDGDNIDFNRCFIDVEGFDTSAMVKIDHCLIENCKGTFINADGNVFGRNHQITIKDSQIDGHCGNFLLARFPERGSNTYVDIENTIFQNCVPLKTEEELNKMDFSSKIDFDSKYLGQDSLIVIDDELFKMKKTQFQSCKESPLNISGTFGNGDLIKIDECIFEDFVQRYPIHGTIENCELNKSRKSIVFGSCGEFLNHETIVRNCSFSEIEGAISVEYGKIEHCQFKDSKLLLTVIGKGDKKEHYISEATDLCFDNCTAFNNEQDVLYDQIYGKPCLCQAKSYLDKNEICVMFYACKFSNCNSRGLLISCNYRGIGAFGRSKNVVAGRELNTTVL